MKIKSWSAVASQLFKLSPVVNWDKTWVEGQVLGHQLAAAHVNIRAKMIIWIVEEGDYF